MCANIKKRSRHRKSVQGRQASFPLEIEVSKANGPPVVREKRIQRQGGPEPALKTDTAAKVTEKESYSGYHQVNLSGPTR